jgi:antitoxin (DNA-binding transcriptional repressor) of toxin-antitoxin stability system
MRFVSVRELRANTATIRKDLESEQELVVTSNGKPFALMVQVDPSRMEQEIKAIRRAKFRMALDEIRAKAKADGLDKMTMEDIDVLIAEVRRESQAVR